MSYWLIWQQQTLFFKQFILSLLIVSSFILTACKPDVIKQEQILFAEMVRDNPAIQQQTLQVGQHRLFYAQAGDPALPALVIVHGTPGNWQQYARYLLNDRLRSQFQVLSIDRPGWGQSQVNLADNDTTVANDHIASFSLQSEIIAGLSQQLKLANDNKPVIYMGHSLGASLLPTLAVEQPQAVDGLLLLAGTQVPDYAKPRWYNYLGAIPGINYLIGQTMRRSNKEIFALKDEMLTMQSRWSELQQPTLIVQGLDDRLVHPENIDVLPGLVNPKNVKIIALTETGHLFPMTERDAVAAWSLCLLASINKTSRLSECTTIGLSG